MNTHLTDFEIQQLAEKGNTDERQLDAHLETCASCKAKYVMYKLMFEEIHISPVPAVPSGFQAVVMEAAAKKQERKILLYYHLLCTAAIIAAIIAMIYVVNGNTNKVFAGTSTGSPGKVNGLEAALIIAAVTFFYICLNGYKTRPKKSNLLVDITF